MILLILMNLLIFVILMILIPRKLQQIELKGNPIHSFDPNAFVQLPALRKLQWVPFSNLYFYDFGNLPCPCVICISRLLGSPRVLNQFPNLTGSSNLELLHMDRCSSFHWLIDWYMILASDNINIYINQYIYKSKSISRINIDRVPDNLCSQVPRLKTL